MVSILQLILLILQIATFIIIAQAIMSWLVAFNVLSMRNDIVRNIWSALEQITEPLYRPIRNIMPRTGGLDLTPMVVLLGIFFLRPLSSEYGFKLVA